MVKVLHDNKEPLFFWSVWVLCLYICIRPQLDYFCIPGLFVIILFYFVCVCVCAVELKTTIIYSALNILFRSCSNRHSMGE